MLESLQPRLRRAGASSSLSGLWRNHLPRPQWGGYDVVREQDFLELTRNRCARFDDLCVGFGRDPKTVGHSLVCLPPLTPWESTDYFRDVVGRCRNVGVDEFVLYWPQSWRLAPHEDRVFEEVCRELLPGLRDQ